MKSSNVNSAVIYCRVSSKEQEETGYSLSSQEKLLSEYADRKEFSVVRIFSVAESASGSKQRMVFAEMMDFMTKNDIRNLVVEKVDRLTRNLKEAVVANDWIDANEERKIHFVKQNLVLHKNAKSDEKFRWDIEIVLAKKYISNLSEEVRKGQIEKIAQGGLPCRPPYGYKTIGEKGHKIHVIDQEKSVFVKRLFELYSSGSYSMKAVLDQLHSEGMRTDKGKRFVKSMIESMLNNPFYYGAIRWNGEMSHGAHEPLITKETFDRVRDIRQGKKAPHQTKHQFQFRKMFKCGECEGTITADIHKGIVYYHCNHYRDCKQEGYTTEQKLEEALFGVFKFFENITVEEAEEIKAKIKADHAGESKIKETTLKSLDERLRQFQKRLDNLYNDRLDGTITPEFWQIKNKEIVTEQNAMLDQVKRLKNDEAKYFEIWLNILDLSRRAREIYEKRSPEERRMLLSHIFSNLVLKDQKVSYTLKKSVEVLAKRVQEKLDAEKTFEPKESVGKQRQKGTFVPSRLALLPG